MVTSPTKSSNSQLLYFLIETTRLSVSLVGLTSSLALSVGKLWPNMRLTRSWLLRVLKVLNIYFSMHLRFTMKPVRHCYCCSVKYFHCRLQNICYNNSVRNVQKQEDRVHLSSRRRQACREIFVKVISIMILL